MKQIALLCITLLAAIGVCSVEATITTKRNRRNLLGTGVGICHKVSETKYETIFVSAFKAAFLLTQSGYKQGPCSDRCHVYCLSYDSYTIASYNCNCYNNDKPTISISDRGGTKGNIITQRLGDKGSTTNNGGLDPRFPSATLIDPAAPTNVSPSFASIINRAAPTGSGTMMGGMMMRGSRAPRAPRAMNGMMMRPSSVGSTIVSFVSNIRGNGVKPLTGTESPPVPVTNRFIAPPALAPVPKTTTTTTSTTTPTTNTSSTPVDSNQTTPNLTHETADPRLSTKKTIDPPATTKEFGVCGNNAVIDHTILDCKCLPGYTGDATKGCYDINECKTLKDVCDDYDNSHCVNVKGSYTCQCDDGYTGNPLNGTQCRSLNQCDSPYGNPCGPDITCKPTDDGYECIEPDDEESCPVICSPSMECKAVTDPVEAKQHKYKCVCKKGYVQTSPFFPCRLPTSNDTLQGQSNDRT